MRCLFEDGAYLSNYCNLQLKSLLHLGLLHPSCEHGFPNVVSFGCQTITCFEILLFLGRIEENTFYPVNSFIPKALTVIVFLRQFVSVFHTYCLIIFYLILTTVYLLWRMCLQIILVLVAASGCVICYKTTSPYLR